MKWQYLTTVAKIYHIEYKKKTKTKTKKNKKTKQREQYRKKNFGGFFFIQNTVHITKVLEFSGICYKFKTN